MIKVDGVDVYSVTTEQQAKGAMIVIHEVWGLTDHIKSVADRVAELGYLVYAPDLLTDTGIEAKAIEQLQKDLFNPEKRNDAQPLMRKLMAPIQEPSFAVETVGKLKKTFSNLYENNETHQKVGVMGYCFGGTYSYSLSTEEPRLVCAIPYYGHADQPVEVLRKINCPVLAFYGEKDEALISGLPDLENRMHQAGVDFSYNVYKNCGHAFFNDSNPYAYNKEAATDAWQRTQDFLTTQFS